MRAFGSLGLTMLAIYPRNPEAGGYRAADNPHYHQFVQRLYRAVATLRASGNLELVTMVDGVWMFRIVYPE